MLGNVLRRPTNAVMAILAITLVAGVLQLRQAPDASAASWGFCNVTLPNNGRCESNYGYMNQVSGVGYSGAVCVGFYPSTEVCSGSANQWVYTPSTGSNVYTAGWISNVRNASNVVDAVYYY
jgi:hypothetical protein